MDDLIPQLAVEGTSKIFLVVIDGLGGFNSPARRSELAEARTPALDALAGEGSSGVHWVVGPGITPGSGAGHLALFGYDPLKYTIGRGLLSALGTGVPLQNGDVAARVNFCTLDAEGKITDRRAGRITDEEGTRFCKLLNTIDAAEGFTFHVTPEKEHRAVLTIRGQFPPVGLSARLSDSDPQREGLAPNPVSAMDPQAEAGASAINEWLSRVRNSLRDEKANFVLLRGFDSPKQIPSFLQRYKLRGAGIAEYPMYLGLSRLVGMQTQRYSGGFKDAALAAQKLVADQDFLYIHQKKSDSAGEDGDFDGKVRAIEEVDTCISALLDLRPDVICVTGDHATPSQMRAHSWHAVPFLVWGAGAGIDHVHTFHEDAARLGAFGHIHAKDLMGILLATAGRLSKYGA